MRRAHHKWLLSEIWEKPGYAKASDKEYKGRFNNNPALVKLLNYSRKAEKILDCGCGEGKTLDILWNKEKEYVGIDLSRRSIKSAEKRFAGRLNTRFLVGNIETLKFEDSSFDLVFSSYTLEHVNDPDKAVSEMIRMLKPGGRLVIICPNYGSPFHPSACSPREGESLFGRAVRRFLLSYRQIVKEADGLRWERVVPKAYREKRWEQDWDCVNEPYLQNLLHFINKRGIEIIEYSSGLEWDDGGVSKVSNNNFSGRLGILKFLRRAGESLGRFGISPYKYFGPTVFVAGRKIKI